ncbi:10279_t:CDS:2, partial [Gigaspora rosea]
VTAINTPGSVESGSTIVITWTWSYTLQANTFTGTLSVVDNVTKKSFIISSLIILATQSTLWVVNVPAGTYYLDINDGSAKAPAPAASSGPQAPTGASPPAPPQSSSNNGGIYIAIAVGGIVVGVFFSFVGYRAYKKHQDSKFIPTPGNADHNV